MRRSANIVLSAASLVLVAGAATGVAEATTSHAPVAGSAALSSSSTTAGSAAAGSAAANSAAAKRMAHPRAGELRHLIRHVAHGSVVVKAKGSWQTVDFQRGTLTAASGSSVTVKSADGFTATYAVTGTTRVRIDRARSTAPKLTTGSRVLVLGVKSGSAVNARWIVERTGALKAPAAGSGTGA